MRPKIQLFILLVLFTCQCFARTITHCRVTYYHPTKKQCDKTPLITADGSKIDLKKLKNKEIKWCAISRDLLHLFPRGKKKLIHVENHGIYEVKDLMHKRMTHCIDLLVHPTDKIQLSNEKYKIIIL